MFVHGVKRCLVLNKACAYRSWCFLLMAIFSGNPGIKFCVEESGFCIGRLSGSELILTSIGYCLVNITSLLFIWGHVCYIFHEYVLPSTHDMLTIQLHYQWIKTVELDLTLIRKNDQLPHK